MASYNFFIFRVDRKLNWFITQDPKKISFLWMLNLFLNLSWGQNSEYESLLFCILHYTQFIIYFFTNLKKKSIFAGWHYKIKNSKRKMFCVIQFLIQKLIKKTGTLMLMKGSFSFSFVGSQFHVFNVHLYLLFWVLE